MNICTISSYLNNKLCKIWLLLIALTLLSASVAESDNVSVWATIFVCSIVIIKGRWIIDHFMGLKTASMITRNLVLSYLYIMTAIVAITLIYSQLFFVYPSS